MLLDCRLIAALGKAINGVLIVLVPQALETFTCTVPLPLTPTFTLHPAWAEGEWPISRTVSSPMVGGMSLDSVLIILFNVALVCLGFWSNRKLKIDLLGGERSDRESELAKYGKNN